MRCLFLVSAFLGAFTQQIHSLRESSVRRFHFSQRSAWEDRICLRSSGRSWMLPGNMSVCIWVFLKNIIFLFQRDHIILYSKAYTSKCEKFLLELKKWLIFFQETQSYTHYKLGYGDNREVYWGTLPKKNDLETKLFGIILREIGACVSYFFH